MLTDAMPSRVPPDQEFHDLIARHASRWRAACLRITGDRSLAEDAVQEGLLLAWRQRSQFRGEAELGSWVHRIALRAAIDLMRKRSGPVSDSEPTPTAEAGDTPQHALWRHAFGRETALAMTSLTDVERLCFTLKHLEQWRLEEIADHLGRSVDSVKQALFRAVKKLRVRLAHWQENRHEQ